MKYVYSLLLVAVLSAGCSKDFLKRYDRRILGTWELFDVDSRGIGGDTEDLPFRDGQFVFSEDGQLIYTDPETGNVYKGDWDLNKLNRNRDEDAVRILTIHAIDFNSQEIRSEQFEDMKFTGTDRFNAFIYSGLHTYVFRFRRQ